MRFLFSVIVASILVAGCGGGEPECTLADRWQGTVVLGVWSGEHIVQEFRPAGEYRLFFQSTQFVGTWSIANDVLTIADGSCVTPDPGMYELRWVDCTKFVYHTIADACPSRGDTLNGITMTQPF